MFSLRMKSALRYIARWPSSVEAEGMDVARRTLIAARQTCLLLEREARLSRQLVDNATLALATGLSQEEVFSDEQALSDWFNPDARAAEAQVAAEANLKTEAG